MNQSDQPKFVEIMQNLAILYGREPPRDEHIRNWWNVFKDVDIIKALSIYANDKIKRDFYPKPIDIIGIIKDNNGIPDADVAWAIVVSAHQTPFSREKVTPEMLRAYGIVKHLLKGGGYEQEKIAIKAFKDKYNEFISSHTVTYKTKQEWFTLREFDQQRIDRLKLENAKKPMIKDSRVTKNQRHERFKSLSELAKKLKQSGDHDAV